MLTRLALEASERGLLPDPLLRGGIRRLLRGRLAAERRDGAEDRERALAAFTARLGQGPVAVATRAANSQHYELPPSFFEAVLGPRLKYSSGLWSEGVADLAAAEEAMLDLTCRRAGLQDGMEVLDLGCGWGSLSLWIAERYPRCRITSVSNSAPQGRHIRERARALGHEGIQVLTADINAFEASGRYHRILSVEMFEHMRNYRELLRRIQSWLTPDGRLFVHIFCHRDIAYAFEDEGDADWMARHFFTGGIMPSADLLARFPEHMRLEQDWVVDGTHYQRTLEAWLANLDARRRQLAGIFAGVYGRRQAGRWIQRWRMFFMACAELFGYAGGHEWQVGHYLLRPERKT